MTPNDLVIAVDGGNSKTDVLLLRSDGTVLSSVRGAGSSPHQLGLEPAVHVVDDLVDRAWVEAGLQSRNGHRAAVAAVFMAGADLPAEEVALADAVRARGWAEQNHVANDVFAVLWAATGTGFGVAVTVGAGVNCVGTAPSGRRAWFPALGDITGDWGGGSDIGMAALGAGVRSEDRRGAPTTLAQDVAGYFGYATALEVAVAIHQGNLSATRLVELPPLVVTAAESGDDEAVAIMHRQGSEVTRLAIAALHQLEMQDASVQVVLGGSILASSRSILLDFISAGIRAEAPMAQTTVCTTRPVVGAALAGLSLAGANGAAQSRLRAWIDDGSA
ncbi:MAG: N-acetylglucosamine kinase [Candidatus Dormibacteria bacterium]